MIVSKKIDQKDISIIPDSDETWLGKMACYEVDCEEEDFVALGFDVLEVYQSKLIDIFDEDEEEI